MIEGLRSTHSGGWRNKTPPAMTRTTPMMITTTRPDNSISPPRRRTVAQIKPIRARVPMMANAFLRNDHSAALSRSGVSRTRGNEPSTTTIQSSCRMPWRTSKIPTVSHTTTQWIWFQWIWPVLLGINFSFAVPPNAQGSAVWPVVQE